MLKTIEAVDRPAILALIPRLKGRACLLDVGANINCTPKNLLDFAYLGVEFAKIMFAIKSPTIAILNIGKEVTKGNDLIKQTHEILSSSKLNFKGFIEANELLLSDINVIVTDGFSGNIALKAMEGAGKFCLEVMKQAANKSWLAKLGLIIFKVFLPKNSVSLDPSEYNGGIFLGLNGIVVKSHGGANIKAFSTSLDHAIKLARSDILSVILKEVRIPNE